MTSILKVARKDHDLYAAIPNIGLPEMPASDPTFTPVGDVVVWGIRQNAHRRSEHPAKKRKKPFVLKATMVNQVYTWDITYLPIVQTMSKS